MPTMLSYNANPLALPRSACGYARTAVLVLTALIATLLASTARGQSGLDIPSYEARKILEPEQVCSRISGDTSPRFQRTECRCREATGYPLYICHPHASGVHEEIVPVVTVLRHRDQWYYLPVVRASYFFYEDAHDLADTWIGQPPTVISKRAGTLRLHVRHEMTFETKVDFMLEGGGGMIEDFVLFQCTGGIAVTIDISGPRPALKTVADELFYCRRGDSDFSSDKAIPHPWFKLPTVNRYLVLDDQGDLVGPSLPSTSSIGPRLFPLRDDEPYTHFIRWTMD